MKTILTCLMLVACVCVLQASETVTLRIKRIDDREIVKNVELKKISDTHSRFILRVMDIPRNTKYIEVVADFAKARKGDDGYFVIGNGMLGRFTRDNGSFSLRSIPLPLYGMKTPNKTFLAVMNGLEYDCTIESRAKGGAYEVFPRYLIKDMGFEPYEDIEIDFYTLTGNDANYSGMARLYRALKLESGVVKPLAERVKKYPLLDYISQSMEVRARLAWKPVPSPIEYQTRDNEPKVTAYITFDRMKQVVAAARKAGIEKLQFCLVGWNIGGDDGRLPDLFPVEPTLGGETKLRELIREILDAGYLVTCQSNSNDAYTIADSYSDNIVCKNPDGSLQVYAVWGGGRTHNVCAQMSWHYFAQKDLPRVHDLGFKGAHFFDVLSCVIPYDCHDLRHPCNRRQYAFYMNKIMQHARDTFGASQSEGPFDHVAGTLDFALYTSFNIMGKFPELIDRAIPFWEIAYNGIIMSNPSAQTVNFPIKDAKTRLKYVEFGGRPVLYYNATFQRTDGNWMGKVDLRCETDEQIEESMKTFKVAQDEYAKFKRLQFVYFDSHDEIVPDVFLSKYADGTEIVCNYNTAKDFDYKGQTIKPEGYILIEPKK
ncbi:MAG: DUF5696 domain-containing protein [Kiritimatiellae bacterium]|nr:DUF5696 domain-containing protein [Kiritimatiellia bacterium]MDD5523109.1 DUF5696 domain-containing protein [Kiritimatiellia bacterium]